VLTNGDWVRIGGSHASALGLSMEHSVTDKLAISLGIPYVAAKFSRNNGPNATLSCPTCPGLDDGKYHGTWQDFTVGARYNVLMQPVVVTPLIALRLPSHSYATAFEAAPGRHLTEVQTGIAAGRVFATSGEPVFLAAQYTYTFVQKLLGVSTNRSNADFTVGRVLGTMFSVRGFVDWQRTHGGLTSDFVLNFDNKVIDPALYRVHNGLIRDNYWRAGIGAGYALTMKDNLYASIATVLGGTDTHYGYLYNIGVSRSFNWKRPDK
jgi:hypothetical protein